MYQIVACFHFGLSFQNGLRMVFVEQKNVQGCQAFYSILEKSRSFNPDPHRTHAQISGSLYGVPSAAG